VVSGIDENISIFAQNPDLMRNHLIVFHLLIAASLISCKSTKPLASSGKAPSVSSARAPGERYISMYKDIAISEMRRTGVPASITLAQGMVESDYGRSRLASAGNNHFGIKCHNGWTGGTIYHNDDRRNDCFRKYKSASESFRDHSDFLKSGSRYSFLFRMKSDDYKSWAYGLKKAGYATNPDYANMIIRKIEEHQLWKYDREFLAIGNRKAYVPETLPDLEMTSSGETTMVSSSGTIAARAPRMMENNRIQYIIVKDGDTREKLEKDYKLLKWELSKYNELESDFIPVPGQILYLQPKREKAEPGKEIHVAAKGDTMYLISQKYGIKMKSLCELNRMEPGIEPEPGKKIWLRNIRPVN